MHVEKLLGKVFAVAFVGGISIGWTCVMYNAGAPWPATCAFALLAIILIAASIIEVWRKL